LRPDAIKRDAEPRRTEPTSKGLSDEAAYKIAKATGTLAAIGFLVIALGVGALVLWGIMAAPMQTIAACVVLGLIIFWMRGKKP
jgi:hypothetical protein